MTWFFFCYHSTLLPTSFDKHVYGSTEGKKIYGIITEIRKASDYLFPEKATSS